MNVRPLIATLVSSGMASLIELQTVYGVKDAYDLVEILTIDAFNRRVMQPDPE